MGLQIAILTVSDRSSRGERPDASGPALKEKVEAQGWIVLEEDIVPDDVMILQDTLVQLADGRRFDVILTTGGTGFAPRDVTPEATQAVIQKSSPGLAEAMRLESLKITPHAMLSRAVAGIRDRTLIINLPGSPKAALENLDVIIPVLPHAVELLKEDNRAEEGHRYE